MNSPGPGERPGPGRGGFTLVEVVLAVGLTGLLLLALMGLLDVAFESFRTAQGAVSTRFFLRDALEAVAEGGFRAPGLRDAAAVEVAERDRVRFLAPLRERWSPDAEGWHTLGRPFLAGAPRPTLHALQDGRWETLPTRLRLDLEEGRVARPGAADGPRRDADRLAVRYLADPRRGPASVVELRLEAGRLVRLWGGRRETLPGRDLGVRVRSLRFAYYDRRGRPLLPRNGRLTEAERAAVAAVAVTLDVALGDTRTGDLRFVDLLAAGDRVLLGEPGLEIADLVPGLPLRRLVLGNLHGAREGDVVRLSAPGWEAEAAFSGPEGGVVRMRAARLGDPPAFLPFTAEMGIPLASPDRRIDAARSPDPEPGVALTAFAEADRVWFQDADDDGVFDAGDLLFLDRRADGRFEPGSDLRLAGSARVEGSPPTRDVAASVSSVRFVDADESGRFEPGEPIVLDRDGDERFGGHYLDDAGLRSPFDLRVDAFEIDGATLFLR